MAQLLVGIEVRGLKGVVRTLKRMASPMLIGRVAGPSLFKAGVPIRDRARARNFVFRDRRGAGLNRRAGRNRQTGKYPSLRSSIRVRRITARYFGTRVARGRAGVYAGGPGSEQGQLVERGHGPPIVAKPYPFLRRALQLARSHSAAEFINSMRGLLPRELLRARRRGALSVQKNSYVLGGSLRARTSRRVFRARQAVRR